MYLEMDPHYPEIWRLSECARALRDGGIGVIPTDTVYAFVCDIGSKSAIERLYQLKQMDAKKPLSMMCRDFADVACWTRGFPSPVYRAMRRCLPGPYTFILRASSATPRIMLNKKRREVGVRIPDDPICQALLAEMGQPLLCSSVRTEGDQVWNEPARIAETYGARIDFVVDAGERFADPSTVVDLTGADPVLLRRGKGDPELFE